LGLGLDSSVGSEAALGTVVITSASRLLIAALLTLEKGKALRTVQRLHEVNATADAVRRRHIPTSNALDDVSTRTWAAWVPIAVGADHRSEDIACDRAEDTAGPEIISQAPDLKISCVWNAAEKDSVALVEKAPCQARAVH
jgi:hypothetical protein